ncbi:hypothetical protein QBC34DRAFT_474169 [Podospora aff. communis PSN243]|uniref:F-box domain-containing protein n=1 Tax=Podospora aff. communis PSN243 TaxID=3040156 RepID=A0AAV9G9D8_9PEZI|nr:hypothetical protein QBC34DRAFT_474169 [Podospora aff. communis PSN243]
MCIPKPIFRPLSERSLLLLEDQSIEPYNTTTIDIPALLSTTTYPSTGSPFNLTYTQLPPSSQHKITTFFLSPFPSAPESRLGSLQPLPLEILHLILSPLPIATLFHLRHVNRRLRQVIHSLPLYTTLATHASAVLLATYRFDLLPNLTLPSLYTLATSDTCFHCGEFAPCIFMPTLQRCCAQCHSPGSRFHKAEVWDVLRITPAQRRLLAEYESEEFRVVRSVPGFYPERRYITKGKRRETLKKRHWVVAKGRVPLKEGLGFKVGVERWNKEGDEVLRDLSGMCQVMVPPVELVDRERKGEEQRGVSCLGCRENWERESFGAWAAGWLPDCGSPVKGMTWRLYSGRGFVKHFEWCRAAQGIWKRRLREGVDGGEVVEGERIGAGVGLVAVSE